MHKAYGEDYRCGFMLNIWMRMFAKGSSGSGMHCHDAREGPVMHGLLSRRLLRTVWKKGLSSGLTLYRVRGANPSSLLARSENLLSSLFELYPNDRGAKTSSLLGRDEYPSSRFEGAG
jgi:hypothetical protein